MGNRATVPLELENGAVMSREQFHALYSECEGLERVELIEGVVYMPSPVRVQQHQRPAKLVYQWLMAYEERHAGEVEAMSGASVLLDDRNEPIPDVMLYRLSPERFEDGYVKGTPELVVEIAASTTSRDLHQKKRAYERNGVREYLVWRTVEGEIDWFQLRDGVYGRREPDGEGIIESEEFPGLRLDVRAMLAGDRKSVLAAVRQD
ncbi:MAG: Uma2 family endonuclease [Tepidiformaceae bacterium]